VAIVTAGGVYASTDSLRLSQSPSMCSLRLDASCICIRQTPVALHLEQTTVYECKRPGDSMLCNATRCKSIGWSPTLADNRDELDHCYAATQHLVHSIWGTHKGDVERGMLMQRPTLDITCSNQYHVRAQVDNVKNYFIHSVKDTIEDSNHLHRFESDAECLEFIDSPLADN